MYQIGEVRRKYSEQFKREAVELSYSSGKTVKEIAEDLGIHSSLLTRWRTQYRKRGELAFPGHGKQRLTPQEEELKRLKRELEIVKKERDILKKPWPSSPKNPSKI